MIDAEANKQRDRKNLVTALILGMLAVLSFTVFFLKVIG